MSNFLRNLTRMVMRGRNNNVPSITEVTGLPAKLTQTIGIRVSGQGNDGRTHSLRVTARQGSDIVMDRTHPPAGDNNARLSIDGTENTFTLGGFPGDLDLWYSDEARRSQPADITVELIREPSTVVQTWPTFVAQGV